MLSSSISSEYQSSIHLSNFWTGKFKAKTEEQGWVQNTLHIIINSQIQLPLTASDRNR